MRVINKICKLLFISFLYENKYGIKSTNQLSKVGVPIIIKCDVIKPEELFLGFDGLRDEYTLVGENIINSPHFGFIKCIDEGKNVIETDYVRRYKKGCLDGRPAIKVNRKSLKRFKAIFEKRKEEISNNSYDPVRVYYFDNRYYISDGKHRAAFCAYLNKKVKCEIINSDYLNDGYKLWIYRKMLRSRGNYSKNINIFENSVIKK